MYKLPKLSYLHKHNITISRKSPVNLENLELCILCNIFLLLL